MPEKEYKVLGFNFNATEIYFLKHEKIISIKYTLPKNILIAYLDIPAHMIKKDLRDDILEDARIEGKKSIVYSLDKKNWQRCQTFYHSINRENCVKIFDKIIPLEYLEEYPYVIKSKEIDEMIEKFRKK